MVIILSRLRNGDDKYQGEEGLSLSTTSAGCWLSMTMKIGDEKPNGVGEWMWVMGDGRRKAEN